MASWAPICSSLSKVRFPAVATLSHGSSLCHHHAKDADIALLTCVWLRCQVRDVIARIVDGSRFDEFKQRYGPQLVCGMTAPLCCLCCNEFGSGYQLLVA